MIFGIVGDAHGDLRLEVYVLPDDRSYFVSVFFYESFSLFRDLSWTNWVINLVNEIGSVALIQTDRPVSVDSFSTCNPNGLNSFNEFRKYIVVLAFWISVFKKWH